MTGKKMRSVDLDLLERIAKPLKFWADKAYRTKAIIELRALLDNPECTTPSGKTCPGDGVGACKKCPGAQHQGESVGKLGVHHVLGAIHNVQGFPGVKGNHIHDLTALLNGVLNDAEHPAPVAVVMPEDWEDQLMDEMSRRFGLYKMVDDDHMVVDDTQIGVEFARDWIKARLNGVKP